VLGAEADRLRALRLEVLRDAPDAFGSTLAGDEARPASWWADWARASEAGVTQRTFVLDDGAAWLGMALVRREPGEPAAAGLYSMWLAPAARGQGATRRLCDACADWAVQRGCAVLRLDVFAGNAGARRAYEAAGFAVVGEGPRTTADGRHVVELQMARPL
jgi:RimJ/RimL family protein N-acetyltransferase